MLADFLRVDPATLAALGLVSVLAGSANTPLAASIMAIELFGPDIAPYATVSCVISFLITGQQSVYPSQRISWDSGKTDNQHPAVPVRYGRRSTDVTHQVRARKLFVKKAWRELTQHLIPQQKPEKQDKNK